jgi:hypothetical protein
MEMQGVERMYTSYSLTILALDGDDGQRHAPAALYPRGEDSLVAIGQEAGWAPEPVWVQRLGEKSSCLCWESNLNRQVVHLLSQTLYWLS